MHPILNCPSRVLQIAAAVFPLVAFAASARADIFQWEYINPTDPGEGKQPSTILCADGAGASAGPGANLSNRNLTMAYLIGADLGPDDYAYFGSDLTGAKLSQADLTNAYLYVATLTGANLSQANLTNANLDSATLTNVMLTQANLTNAYFHNAALTGADLTGADVRGARFNRGDTPSLATGITLAQLYSTASYQSHDLSGIGLRYNNLTGAHLAGQNLTRADFYGATLTDSIFRGANLTNACFAFATLTGADFSGAEIRGASFNASSHCAFGPPCFDEGTGLTLAQLYSTASYQGHDLSRINFAGSGLSGWNFAGQNLTDAYFGHATLTGADFSSAEIRGARFSFSQIALAQLYSTASYQAHDLTGIGLEGNDLSGWNFSGQNLANANFGFANLTGAAFRVANLTNASFFSCIPPYTCKGSTLTDADLTAADARGAQYLDIPASANTANLIRPNGHINGLELGAGGLLVVRDYDGDSRDWHLVLPVAITVGQHLTMGPGGTLRMVFEADAWDSTVSYAPGIPVTLGGTLELTFAADVNPATQVGRTFDLFDWTGISPTGAFAMASPYAWNLSNLYTTGQVTLTAIPEPCALLLFTFALSALVAMGRVRLSSNSGKGENQ